MKHTYVLTLAGLMLVGAISFLEPAQIASAAACTGVYQYQETDVSDLACVGEKSCIPDVKKTNVYSAVPDCPQNPEGKSCTRWCKINTAVAYLVYTELFACVGSDGQPIGKSCDALTASLVANPTAIQQGGQSLLTWSSTGATSCTGTNFVTGGAPQGTVAVTPSATTQYSVMCTGAAGSAVANATVTVGNDFAVSCRAHPRSARPNDDVLWSSTVSGPPGTYTYSWSGTDGLTGTLQQVFKRYTTPGHKDAWLTVTLATSNDSSAGASQSTSGGAYQLVKSASYFTKVCSGGSNTTNTQKPSCSDFVCSAATVGDRCKVHGYDDGGCTTGPGVITVTGEQTSGPTIYSWVTDYVCTATSHVSTQASNNCSAVTQTASGLYPLASSGSTSIMSDFHGAISLGKNTYGYYLANGSGTPLTGKVVYGNVQNLVPNCVIDWTRPVDESRLLSTCTLNPPLSTTIAVPQTNGATHVGFFIVPDGASFTNGAIVSITQGTSGWLVNGKRAYFSDPSRNDDKRDHEVDIPALPGNSNWEDAFNVDSDHNDVMVNTSVRSCVAQGDSATTRSITVQCESGVDISGDPRPEQCNDGIDNDEDGKVDLEDPDCTSSSDDSEGTAQCADGRDNNGDGTIDLDDPGCTDAEDNLEFVPNADLTLLATPPLIKKGQSCTLQVAALYVKSCTLSGPGVTQTYQATGGTINATTVITPALQLTSQYKLSCLGQNGVTKSKTVECKVAPTFEEI